MRSKPPAQRISLSMQGHLQNAVAPFETDALILVGVVFELAHAIAFHRLVWESLPQDRIGVFRRRCDHVPADQYRAARTQAFQTWSEITGVAALALSSDAQSRPHVSLRPQLHMLRVPCQDQQQPARVYGVDAASVVMRQKSPHRGSCSGGMAWIIRRIAFALAGP